MGLAPIQRCSEAIEPLSSRLSELAATWAESSHRPRVPLGTIRAWEELLAAWARDERLPLFVRRIRSGRGSVIFHESGREIVPTDNSPANWSLSLALSGQCPTLDDVRALFEADEIPIALALRKAERQSAKYSCTRRGHAHLNDLGWKVAHLEDVGLGYRFDVARAPLTSLTSHFRRFLAPSNMFVVPLHLAALSELPQFIEAVGRSDRYTSPDDADSAGNP
jgi:hypothetical protein